MDEKVTIKFTYKFTEDLQKVYYELSNCQYVGRHTRPVSYDDAGIKLKSMLKQRFLDSRQMSIMEIYYEGELVGMSLPRHWYTEEEKNQFRVDNSYYKIGKIIILDEFRNKGIALEACKKFLKVYPKIMYHTAEDNTQSLKLVEKLQIPFSHDVVIDGINYKVFKK